MVKVKLCAALSLVVVVSLWLCGCGSGKQGGKAAEEIKLQQKPSALKLEEKHVAQIHLSGALVGSSAGLHKAVSLEFRGGYDRDKHPIRVSSVVKQKSQHLHPALSPTHEFFKNLDVHHERTYYQFGCDDENLISIEAMGYLEGLTWKEDLPEESYLDIAQGKGFLRAHTLVFCGANFLRLPLRLKLKRLILAEAQIVKASQGEKQNNIVHAKDLILLGDNSFTLEGENFSDQPTDRIDDLYMHIEDEVVIPDKGSLLLRSRSGSQVRKEKGKR